jgi:nucleotidyltransferase substrate binding protein (TIGR01987 family)
LLLGRFTFQFRKSALIFSEFRIKMDVHKLGLAALIKATLSLEEAINEHAKHQTNQFIRDAAIHRFKYTYELTYKYLKKYLEITEPIAEEISSMPFVNLIRIGIERGLLANGWDAWKNFRAARNTISHTYNEKMAIDVYTVIPQFLQESKHLLAELKKRVVQDME